MSPLLRRIAINAIQRQLQPSLFDQLVGRAGPLFDAACEEVSKSIPTLTDEQLLEVLKASSAE